MAEKQVTLEGETYKLPKPFFVIATQNPVEQFGTFPLPESQMDRFMMKISIGYPTREAEKEILKGGSRREELYRIQPVMDPDEVIKIQNEIDQVYISDRVIDYILDIAEVTRSGKFFSAGLSIRGTLALVKTAKQTLILREGILLYLKILKSLQFTQSLTGFYLRKSMKVWKGRRL